MLIAPIENENFKYEHLLSSLQNIEDIKSFSVAKETGKGLEFYLKERAEAEERTGENRTYLVRDKETNELAAYFSLHTGSFTIRDTAEDGSDIQYTIPSVELSNFAVNSVYRRNHPAMAKIGEQVFNRFVLPAVKYGAELFGIQALHIYALPYDDLLSHYSSFGFSRLPAEMETFVHKNIKPDYDQSCIFMYQIL